MGCNPGPRAGCADGGYYPGMAKIVMYTKAMCPYCTMAKRLLGQKGQDWLEIDVAAEPARHREMIDRSGRGTVPQIFIGETHVGGYDELAAMEHAGELDALLAPESEG